MDDRLFPTDKIINGEDYYALTFTASETGQVYIDGYTMWVGYADQERKVELRKLSTVVPENMSKYWVDFEMPFCIVNDVDDFAKWYVSGGHALVAEHVVKKVMPSSLEPDACVKLGSRGFSSLNIISTAVFNKAPTPKKRMEVLKRDRFRCRVCGRKVDDYVDIELHVHHVRPVSNGGLTHEDNLITLCHTCHNGLDPHYEWSLYALLENESSDLKAAMRRKYLKGVDNYRKARKAEVSGAGQET